jgi:hypothetical protein
MSKATYIRSTSHSVIKGNGEQGYLLKTTTTLNPITGRQTQTTAKHLVWMAFGKINTKEDYGVDFSYDDRRVRISAIDLNSAGVTPDKDDKIIVAGKTWVITWVHEYRVEGTTVEWMCKVRV